jgi:hypothetical protein
MKLNYVTLLLTLTIFFSSCAGQNTKEANDFRSEGKYNAQGKEYGLWRLLDADNKLMEMGYFKDGIRTGIWKYYFPTKDSIDWMPFYNNNHSIVTNIPSFLEVRENYDSLAFFMHRDSSQLFKMTISKVPSTFSSLQKYHDSVIAEFARKKVHYIDSSSQRFATSQGNTYIYHQVHGIYNDQPFYAFNVGGIKGGNSFIEVTLRTSADNESQGRKVFFSIIQNLYIDAQRFMNNKDLISAIQ